MVRKIPEELENPIDDIIILMADKSDILYKNLNMTPNHLTTLSLIFGIFAAQQLYVGNKALAVVLFLIAYYYDCMDGNYARKYDMETVFGDYYDHFSDWFKYLILFVVMYNLNPKKAKIVIPIILLLCIPMAIHFGCQEKLYNQHTKQPLISNQKYLCPNEKYINITKYFGSGTFIMATVIFMYTF